VIRTKYDWKRAVARCMSHPGRWVLTHQDVPAKAARRVRLKQHPDLIVKDGVLQARIENEYRHEDGQLRGTLWMRYIPHDT
jgi:hypothetical protein